MLRIEDLGTVVFLRPETAAGRTWIDDNVIGAEWQYFGAVLIVERGPVAEILAAARDAGLEVRA